ncbi:MAG: ArsR family transcriptional regulator [Gammaproteobacteria bacterium]|nr:ArsR family transcriptional regulator [Gammaproteobacteria bacterium]
MKLSLAEGTALYRLLADPSRLRLLLLLEGYGLSATELTEITGLAQSRVSTHLTRLVRAGLLEVEREGKAALYRLSADDSGAAELWRVMQPKLGDAQARLDRERAEEIVRARTQSWADSVAGRMERYYSPGRTWEATARALINLVDLREVLDIASGDGVLAELLADRARAIICVDISYKVLSAARRRLNGRGNVSFCRADMHRLPLSPESFDHVFLMHALAYTREPALVLQAAAQVLKPGGRLVVAALHRHRHTAAMRAYDHVNLGIGVDALHALLIATGLRVETCRITSREPRPPYFEVISALARAPDKIASGSGIGQVRHPQAGPGFGGDLV